ncbi:extracellular solute-binding protein [Alicyclobacillus fastidiosus]|uniref:Extracellular solute-binding protein n=1 Tax=Alicyclobacillus fastidiosus TaxID=392011 RepID=A0ABV5A9Z3_9BACL|nr:extracellular solute-binding protein [Alicyclobacillus fastidiosus]WEH07751.1 extracellular solute-binding protein [Alicyclobacillus fastidiosus]
MKTTRRVLTVLSTSVLTVSTLVGCGTSQSNNTTNAAASTTNEPTLTIATGVIGGKNPQENTAFANAIGQALHCKVQLISTTGDYDQKLTAMLAAGQKIDVVYTEGSTLATLAKAGEVTNLQSQIEKSSVLGDPKVVPQYEWNDIKLSSPNDQGIYGVPVKYQGALMPIVREDWLKQLGLSQPKTLNDFYQVFQAFKTKEHAYGLTLSSLYDIEPFMSAVGLKNGYVETDGKLSIPYATSAAVPVYAWLHKLYANGLLDPNFVTNSTADERNLFLSNRVGMFVYWDAWVPMLNNLAKTQGASASFDAEALPGAVGPNGKSLVSMGDTSLFAIPSNAPDKALAFKFLEWWNTQSGEVLGSLGVKGIDYTVNNGKYQLTSVGTDENMDHGDPEPISSYWQNPFPQLQKGYANARQIGIEDGYQPLINANWTNAQNIIWKYGDEAILGKLSPQAAVQQMHAELLRDHYIDQ